MATNYRWTTTMQHQQGVALVMALVILAILTILGITAMSTSSLQEKMAGNIQEQTKSFQASESGLTRSFNDPGTFVATSLTTKTYTVGNTEVEVKTNFRQQTPPPRGSGYGSSCSAMHFGQDSTGVTGTIGNPRAKTVIHRGVAQIVC